MHKEIAKLPAKFHLIVFGNSFFNAWKSPFHSIKVPYQSHMFDAIIWASGQIARGADLFILSYLNFHVINPSFNLKYSIYNVNYL